MLKKLCILFLVLIISVGFVATKASTELDNLIENCKMYLTIGSKEALNDPGTPENLKIQLRQNIKVAETQCIDIRKKINEPSTPEQVKQALINQLRAMNNTLNQEQQRETQEQKFKQIEQEKQQQEFAKKQAEEEKVKAAFTILKGKYKKFNMQVADVQDENIKISGDTVKNVHTFPRVFIPINSTKSSWITYKKMFSALEDACSSIGMTIVTPEELTKIIQNIQSSNQPYAIGLRHELISTEDVPYPALVSRKWPRAEKEESYYHGSIIGNINRGTGVLNLMLATPLWLYEKRPFPEDEIRPVPYGTFCK